MCSQAGEANAKGEEYVDIAQTLHDLCNYPNSCTCQHRVGEGNVSEEAKRGREGHSVSGSISKEGRA
jgi:hypothetical protein